MLLPKLDYSVNISSLHLGNTYSTNVSIYFFPFFHHKLCFPKEYSWLIVTLALLGKLVVTSAYQIAIFYSSELFPTEVRSRGVGTCFMMSRVGSICSPFITDFLVRLINFYKQFLFSICWITQFLLHFHLLSALILKTNLSFWISWELLAVVILSRETITM